MIVKLNEAGQKFTDAVNALQLPLDLARQVGATAQASYSPTGTSLTAPVTYDLNTTLGRK